MKIIKILVVLLISSILCLMHEVPLMTRYKLVEKNDSRLRIKKAKIKSVPV